MKWVGPATRTVRVERVTERDETRTRSADHRIRDVLDALAAELELFERAGRITEALAGASWKALKSLGSLARVVGAPPGKTPGPATCLRDAAAREIGRRPRYQIGDRIAVGGMAEVFRGWQIGEGFERPVAIKRLLPNLVRDARYARLVEHEADVLARMLHPNIVQMIDVVRDDDGHQLLVLEYIDGIHLRKLFHSGALSHAVIVFIVAEILNGLGYAHHLPTSDGRVLGVVHRDLSLDNILVSWDGAVKLADFGIAKRRDKTEVSMTLPVQGKSGYMSPEQHRGERLDGRSDLYSVGVMLWELLAHERLFARETARQFERVPRPSTRRPVPRDLEAVAMRLLRADRERRYRTAEAAYDAIARCDAGSWLRGRVELIELLAERFPDQAARRSASRPRERRDPPTPKLADLPGARRVAVRERWNRWRWSMRRARWERQRWQARRLPRRGWRVMTIAVCLAAMLGLALAAVMTAKAHVLW